MAKSIEEAVEDAYKSHLKDIEVTPIMKTESMGDEIDKALEEGPSKSGGPGVNRPDIRFWAVLLDNKPVPVMVEAKGTKDRLVKFAKDGSIARETPYSGKAAEKHEPGEMNWSAVENYAVNGAVHYAHIVVEHTTMDAAIAIGVNGYMRNGAPCFEHEAYWISRDNGMVPKRMDEFSEKGLERLDDVWPLFKAENADDLASYIENLHLTEDEREEAKRRLEDELEGKVKGIHQRLYDSPELRNVLSTNEKLYLFCALIMAGLPAPGIPSLDESGLKGIQEADDNDGVVVLEQVRRFLRARGNTKAKIGEICDLFKPILMRKAVWRVNASSRESLLKSLFRQVRDEVVPYLTTTLRLDFTGKILNSLNDWVQIENDKANDVVLTPRCVTDLMARLARTDRNSFVWDSAMGSAGMLVSALDIMERDVRENVVGRKAQEAKLAEIHARQLLGVEILGNIYVLAVLNMILMGDGSSNVRNDDSFEFLNKHGLPKEFPANVFLLNPPYSAPGKGLNFVARAVGLMETGYACVLIQENAGSGNDDGYAAEILKKATLRASIHMPNDLFHGKSVVQTAVYLFECGRAHEPDDEVVFVDMSEDGYKRQNRRKSTSKVNLQDDGTASQRYDEVVAHALGKKSATDYYTVENGKLLRDTVGVTGGDWAFGQHKVVDLVPSVADFRKTVTDYLNWRVSQVIGNDA